MTSIENKDELRAKLNRETSKMAWTELQRFFAAGSVIAVSGELDLVEVGASIACDDTAAVTHWMAQQKVAKVSDTQAAAWLDADTVLWAVVVKPWVLVQESIVAPKTPD